MPTNFSQKVGYPLFNGRYYSFSSIEVWMGKVTAPQLSFKAINWKTALKPGMGRGTTPNKLIRTRGESEPEGDFEMYVHAWEAFKLTLAAQGAPLIGYGEVEFDIVVQMREEPNLPIATYMLKSCRCAGEEYSNSSGTDPATVKVTLDVMDILTNGLSITGIVKPGLI